MASVLVVYGTGEGQTAKVADRIVERLDDLGHDPEAFDVEALPTDLDLGSYDGVLVGASVHRGRHQRGIRSFVRAHHEDLAALPSGFFQVSLSAAVDDEAHHTETMGYVDELVEETAWHPDRIAVFGGALRYSEYGFLTRSLMKFIARRETGDTDTARDYEYTDWDEVTAFAEGFGAFLEGQLDLRARADPETGV
jgi:menaquinone-dependent protoporphyrinogen oxidase